MTLFWILAAALVVAALIALLRPLLRAGTAADGAPDARASNLRILRDQLAELEAEAAAGTLAPEQLQVARAELERRVLEETDAAEAPARAGRSRASAAALALALPVLAFGLYLQLGNRDGMDPILSKPAQEATAHDVETLVERLAQRMRAQPADPEGWALLGRAYSSMQRFELARDAFAQAVARKPGDAQLLADYADSLAMTQGRTLAGEPERLIQLALQADPANIKALALAGSAAMERRDYRSAIAHWQKAREGVPPGSDFAVGLDQSLAEARAAAGLPATTAAAQPAAAPVVVNGRVRIAPELLARVQPGDTLFVYARPADGARMPLAVQRGQVDGRAESWPVAFTLDETMAMTPQMTLATVDRVVIGARISRSGNATPQPGDLEGLSAALKPGGGPVELVIDQVRP